MNNFTLHNENWQEFIGGNNHSLSKLYEPYFQSLLFIALKYVRNKDVAQDITSELFLTLLDSDVETRNEKWGQIKDVKAFLTTIIKCRALDYLKIQQNRSRILENQQFNNTLVHESLNEDLEHLKICINKLPLDEQELLKLHLFGYKNLEIAENLNRSEKTVRNKLSASRKKLIYLWNNLIFVLLCQL